MSPDEQLVALFRGGSNDAFAVIYDRYHTPLLRYARGLLSGSRPDAEDALQDVFLRAYHALRADDRPVALRAWLYRLAHNRCVDQLRRPALPWLELAELLRPPSNDPLAQAQRRADARRLFEDVDRLPDQQRSALLLRELDGLSHAELSSALGVSISAVKALLVRARIGVARTFDAHEDCEHIRHDLAVAHARHARASGRVRWHMHHCPDCRDYNNTLVTSAAG